MDFEAVISSRKSIRRFGEGQISAEEIQKIVYAGMAAPVSNRRYKDLHFTVIQSEEVLSKIQALVTSINNVFYGAKTIILVSSKRQPIPGVTEFNVGCTIENMLLATTNLGLGGIYLSYFLTVMEDPEKFRELVRLPIEFEPLSAIGIGKLQKEELILERHDIEGRIGVEYI